MTPTIHVADAALTARPPMMDSQRPLEDEILQRLVRKRHFVLSERDFEETAEPENQVTPSLREVRLPGGEFKRTFRRSRHLRAHYAIGQFDCPNHSGIKSRIPQAFLGRMYRNRKYNQKIIALNRRFFREQATFETAQHMLQ